MYDKIVYPWFLRRIGLVPRENRELSLDGSAALARVPSGAVWHVSPKGERVEFAPRFFPPLVNNSGLGFQPFAC